MNNLNKKQYIQLIIKMMILQIQQHFNQQNNKFQIKILKNKIIRLKQQNKVKLNHNLMIYHNIGLNKQFQDFYPWQQQTLINYGLQKTLQKNLLILAGTASGKSYVTSIFVLKELLINNKSVIITVPYVSLVDELIIMYKQLLPVQTKLQALTGYKAIPQKPYKQSTLYIATIEKSVQLLKLFIRSPQYLNQLGLIVSDETHFLGDQQINRGTLLETFLINILTLQKYSNIQAKLISISATIDNQDQFKSFLQADLITAPSFRPCKLEELVYYRQIFYSFETKQNYKTLQVTPQNELNIIIENSKQPILVFCDTKRKTKELAQSYKKYLIQKQNYQIERTELQKQIVNQSKKDLTDPTYIDYGVYYHNSELSSKERSIVELAFKDKIINVLFATTTLAAGVNLPCQSVIISSEKVGRTNLQSAQYQQMIGRAGRVYSGQNAESILCLSNDPDWEKLEQQYHCKNICSSKINDQVVILNNSLQLLFCYCNIKEINPNIQFPCEKILKDTLFYIQHQSEESQQEISIFQENFNKCIRKIVNFTNILSNNQNSYIITSYGKSLQNAGISAIEGIWFNYIFQQKIEMNKESSDIAYLIIAPLTEYFKNQIAIELIETNENNFISLNKLFSNIFIQQEQIKKDIINFSIFVEDIDDQIFHILNNENKHEIATIQYTKICSDVILYKIGIIKFFVEYYEKIQECTNDDEIKKMKQDLNQKYNLVEDILKQALVQCVYVSQILKDQQYHLWYILVKQVQDILEQIVQDDISDMLCVKQITERQARILVQQGFQYPYQVIQTGKQKFQLLYPSDNPLEAVEIFNYCLDYMQKSIN